MQKLGSIEEKEMFNTFNMGIGLVLAVRLQDSEEILGTLRFRKAYVIGRLPKVKGVEFCGR